MSSGRPPEKKGRTNWLAPDSSPLQHLHYGRIILDPSDQPVRFNNPLIETGLVCLSGKADIEIVGASSFALSLYDALYVPRDSEIVVTSSSEGCDLAEISAPVEQRYPVRFVSFETVRQDPALHFHTGGEAAKRELNILIGKNVEAGRIMAGVTFSQPGNWTSWPPHEHAEMLEEAYLYIDMPAPAFGIQLVYADTESPELISVVREGDCVLMPKGYHPNVAAPGGSIKFLWMMAARREVVDRQFGVVNVQPEFASQPSGLQLAR